MHIAIEGCSCVGKTTLINKLKELLRNTDFVKFPRNLSKVNPFSMTEDCLSDMNDYFDNNKDYTRLVTDRSIISTYVHTDDERHDYVTWFNRVPDIDLIILIMITDPKQHYKQVKEAYSSKPNLIPPEQYEKYHDLNQRYLDVIRMYSTSHPDTEVLYVTMDCNLQIILETIFELKKNECRI